MNIQFNRDFIKQFQGYSINNLMGLFQSQLNPAV